MKITVSWEITKLKHFMNLNITMFICKFTKRELRFQIKKSLLINCTTLQNVICPMSGLYNVFLQRHVQNNVVARMTVFFSKWRLAWPQWINCVNVFKNTVCVTQAVHIDISFDLFLLCNGWICTQVEIQLYNFRRYCKCFLLRRSIIFERLFVWQNETLLLIGPV